jgi:hypothetical protein
MAGGRYQVQSSPDLRSWSNVGAGRIAAGTGDSIGVDPGGPAAFYRVLRLP